jgi:hypothetical protein
MVEEMVSGEGWISDESSFYGECSNSKHRHFLYTVGEELVVIASG